MTDEIKIPEEIKEDAENLQELVEEELGDAAVYPGMKAFNF